MYIFSRTSVAALGKQADAVPASVAIAAKVTEVTGHAVHTFAAQFGAPMGTIMWSATFDSNAERQDMNEKLAADAGFVTASAEITSLFMTPAEDRFARVLTAPVEPTSRFYGITRAEMADGKFAEAIEFGIQMADYVMTSLELPGAFSKAEYGGFGDVSWVLGFDSAADLDRFSDWQMSDAGYQERVNSAAGLFAENSGSTSLIEKLN